MVDVAKEVPEDPGQTHIQVRINFLPLGDLLEVREALLTAKNGLTLPVADCSEAELEFQRDTGLLKIDEKGTIS